MSAVFLWNECFRRGAYGDNHPLSVPRVPLTFDLCRAYEAFSADEVLVARPASDEELCLFHSPEYVDAYRRAERDGRVDAASRERFQLGTQENPYFPNFFTIPATAAGAGLAAAEAVLAGRMAFNPAGGMHHARRGEARGFCFLNDAVLSILRLRRAGWRVLYVDIDAHHGDGVEEAFRDDPAVMTLSLHMDTDWAYPFRGGRFDDHGSAASGYTTFNVPLPRGVHDDEYALLFDAIWAPILAKFRPDGIVLQAGADSLRHDPLAKLRLSTQAYLGIVARVVDQAPRHRDGTPKLLVTGGGGYHPLAVARAWSGVWGLLSGRDLAEALPPAAVAVLRGSAWQPDDDEAAADNFCTSRLDAPCQLAIRRELRDLAYWLPSHPFFSAS